MKTRSAAAKEKAAAKENFAAEETAVFRFKPCPRHESGGVKCVACMKAGLTRNEWAQQTAAAVEKKRPHPVLDTRSRKAPKLRR